MSVRSLLAGVAASAVAATALGFATVAPASADPSFTPDANDIVGVGSDTIEDVMDALAAAYDKDKTAADAQLVSFSTVTPAGSDGNITLREGSTPIKRPVGSGAGKKLLYGAGNNTDVSYARSSSAISADEKNAGLYAFPFAVDSLKMAVSGSATNAPASLTPAQVVGIYAGTYTNWSELGGKDGAITPLLPQSGSGTRSFFDAQLKAANGGAAVTYASTVNDAMHENTDDLLKSDPNAIAPFSVAKQKTLYPTTVHLEAGTASWDRAVYNVVRATQLADPTIQAIFGSSGYICSAAARPVIQASGFSQLATSANGGVCGDATQEATSNLTINEAAPSTTSLKANTATAGKVTLTATVTSSTPPAGTVTFSEGDTVIAANVPLTSGQAVATVTAPAGAHTYTAAFTPELGSSVGESSDEVTATVKMATKIAVSAKPVKKGQMASAVVTVAKGAAGTVAVKVGSKVVKVKVKNGKATVKLGKLSKTTKFTAVYSGDAMYAAAAKKFKVKVTKK